MTQLRLLEPARPEIDDRIDLRCCDVEALIADLDEVADLVIADPPWSYTQRAGASAAGDHYGGLSADQIAAILDRIGALRLALWLTNPLLGEWIEATSGWSWGLPTTGGAWIKSDPGDSGHYGQGYHWAGCSEPVWVYSRGGHTDRSVMLRNGWHEPPGAHSRKPVAWQAQWIRRWVRPGGLVVDPFAGMGSVAEAVLLAGEGRRYLGSELDPKRHQQALALIAQVRGAP